MNIETTTADTLAPLAYSVSEACKVSTFGRTYLYQLINEGQLECQSASNRDPLSARKRDPLGVA